MNKNAFTLAGTTHVAIFDNGRRNAFTLAEVLITLGIIGVVAAMTMPTLIQSGRNQALNTGLQKAYSTLNQALTMYENDNGWPVTSALGRHELKPILMKYIKSVKDCGYGSGDGDKACMPNKAYVSDPDSYKDIYKTFKGKNNIYYSHFDDGQFVMNDSMFVMIENAGTAGGNLIYISVDVNGFNKKPNRLGQDLFMFQIDNNGKFLPMGAQGTTYYSETDDYCSLTSDSNMNGVGCTVKALSDKDFFQKLPK